jgi:hypothetical protein
VLGLAATLLFGVVVAARQGSLSPPATLAMLVLAVLAALIAVLHIGSGP